MPQMPYATNLAGVLPFRQHLDSRYAANMQMYYQAGPHQQMFYPPTAYNVNSGNVQNAPPRNQIEEAVRKQVCPVSLSLPSLPGGLARNRSSNAEI